MAKSSINTYAKLQSRKVTPQSQSIPGTSQVQNTADGFSFAVDQWTMLDRFLILGTEGGTYYIGEQKLTRDACKNLERCIAEDAARVVNRIYEISIAGRAFKQDALIFALALTAKTAKLPNERQLAYDAMPHVCRTGTMLFSWLDCIKQIGGISRGVRRSIGRWYSEKRPESLAYQLVKYRQRGGWTHRDVLRVGHVAPAPLLAWAAGKLSDDLLSDLPPIVGAFVEAQRAETPKATVRLIIEHGLTREMVRTDHLTDPDVWAALLVDMPFTAMVRNLGKMSSVGLLKPLSATETVIADRLAEEKRVVGSRIHPVAVLNALKTYAQGHGRRGSLSWDPCARVVDALERTFELSFSSIEPTGRRFYLALDVSGSMGHGYCAGADSLTPAEGAAAVAMVQARSGDPYVIRGFSDEMRDMGITARDSLRTVIERTRRMTFGRTDCAVPMLDALKQKLEVDCFVVYTDNETWYGLIHPCQALAKYRRETGIAAKLVVVGMEGNKFTIADPSDGGMLDVVGFDSACPRLIQEFAKG